MPYPIPTDHERRALFAWLKQASSLTAWRRQYSFHQLFLDCVESVYEEEQKTVGMTLTVPTGWVSRLLQSHDAFGAALARLDRGDRRCFTFLGARGHFSEGLHAVRWWQDMYGGYVYGRNGFEPADSPRWTEIENAMHDCLAALSDIDVVLQDRIIDLPAPIRELTNLQAEPTSSLFKHWLAQPQLPPVPLADPEVFVSTGNPVPYTGVWEPVTVTRKAWVSGDLNAPAPRPGEGVTVVGCMNYLHGDFDAPTIAFPEDNQRGEGKPTTWRLVWRDERYADGSIPEEEQSFSFVQPVQGEVLFRY